MTRAMTRFLRYSSDLVIWFWTILFKGESCHPYNVGSDQEISISQLAETAASTLGGSVLISTPSHNVSASRYVPSVDRAIQELGLQVRTDLTASIGRTASWRE